MLRILPYLGIIYFAIASYGDGSIIGVMGWVLSLTLYAVIDKSISMFEDGDE